MLVAPYQARKVVDTQSILSARLDSSHIATLQEGVATGYSALAEIMRGTPVLASFWPGRGTLGYLADPCVQYGIELAAKRRNTFYTELVANSVQNHVHTRFHTTDLCITTHFTGRDASRKGARSAVNRAELAKRCGDLFSSLQEDLTAFDSKVYVHLLHGGEQFAKSAVLAIPDRSQSRYPLVPWALDLAPAVKIDIEEVADNLQFAVKALHSSLVESREAG